MSNSVTSSQDLPENGYANVASVERALDILEALAGSSRGLTLTELSSALGINKSIVGRLLATLERKGYVRRYAMTERFTPSFKLLGLAYRHAATVGFPGVVRPILEQLARETGELTQIAAREGDELRWVACAEGADHRVLVRSIVGEVAPLHATAAGLAFLSALPHDQALTLAAWAGLRAYTPRTPTTLAELGRRLDEVRANGYAVVEEGTMSEISAVAAPITAGTAAVPVGALVVAGPISRLPTQRLVEMAPQVIAAARAVGEVWPPELASASRLPRD